MDSGAVGFNGVKNMEQYNPGQNLTSNPDPHLKKNILLWFLVFFAALAVVFFSASFVRKLVEKNKVKKQQQLDVQKQTELKSQTTSQEDALNSVTAPAQPESTSGDSQPMIDQAVIDSITILQANTSIQQEEKSFPVVDQETLNSLSVPAKK